LQRSRERPRCTPGITWPTAHHLSGHSPSDKSTEPTGSSGAIGVDIVVHRRTPAGVTLPPSDQWGKHRGLIRFIKFSHRRLHLIVRQSPILVHRPQIASDGPLALVLDNQPVLCLHRVDVKLPTLVQAM
jgi:hypothetical protein